MSHHNLNCGHALDEKSFKLVGHVRDRRLLDACERIELVVGYNLSKAVLHRKEEYILP